MALVERHIAFVEALREAGLPVSLAEDLDAAAALTAIEWDDRETMRAAYAATLVKRQVHRASFDSIFDIYFAGRVGGGRTEERLAAEDGPVDTGERLAALREELAEALINGDDEAMRELAVEALARFGAIQGRSPGQSSWSAYTALKRVAPESLVFRIMQALQAQGIEEDEGRATASRRVQRFSAMVERDARRRLAEEKGPEHVARVAIRPSIDKIDFTSARRADLEEMRREIYPLARRLATRLTKERHARRRGALDFRRTVRASISTGGVPLTTHHRPTRPHRTELVVLCDVSGSVANFASFTLMLVFALRDQFTKVRAFTFIDHVHEVTHHFRPGADPGDVMAALAASTSHAALWGRTNYGRAFSKFAEQHADALGPKTSLLVLGDARSNYSDLAIPTVRDIVSQTKHAWWLNPAAARNWGTGDSAAHEYGALFPMVECRNLVQLGEFVHDLV